MSINWSRNKQSINALVDPQKDNLIIWIINTFVKLKTDKHHDGRWAIVTVIVYTSSQNSSANNFKGTKDIY